MTVVALVMLLTVSALGLADFWADVGVTLAWFETGDDGWATLGAVSAGWSGCTPGVV